MSRCSLSNQLNLAGEKVAGPVHGLDQARVLGIVVKLAAQARDAHVYTADEGIYIAIAAGPSARTGMVRAAHGGEIKTRLSPDENVRDRAELPDYGKNKLEIVAVKWIDQGLERALERQPDPIKSSEVNPAAPVGDDKSPGTIVTH